MKILVSLESNKTVDELRDLNFMRDCRRVRSKELRYRRIFYVLFLLVLGLSVFANLEVQNYGDYANKIY